MPQERFSIAQVTPYGWEQHHEVNRFVERLSDELCSRGHRIVVVAPSDSRELIRESRAAVKRCAEDPEAIFSGPGCAQVLGVGQSLSARRAGPLSVPLDVSRTIEDLLDHAQLDFVHVHEPFAPSASSVALRHSRALNVGSFHSTTERVLSTQVARKLVELVFGRLDGRTASYGVTRDLVSRFFPGDYRVISPGADLAPRPEREEREIVEILLPLEEERAALRFFLRAVRALPPELPWHVTIWSRTPGAEPALNLPRAIRDRVRFVGPRNGSEAQHLATADVVVAASNGVAPAPQMLLRAMAGGAVPVASRLPLYEETLDFGDRGLLFEPRDADTLAGQLARLVAEAPLRRQIGSRVTDSREGLMWSRVADEFEALYSEIAARRHSTEGKASVRRRLGGEI